VGLYWQSRCKGRIKGIRRPFTRRWRKPAKRWRVDRAGSENHAAGRAASLPGWRRRGVADKGYHSGEVLKDLHNGAVRSYIPEPDRGRRNWKGAGKAEEQKRTYENRRRVRGDRGQRLQKMRSELTERSIAHMYETGAMRRVHLRGRENILKRLLIPGAAFNLSLILRKTIGVGKPRQLQGLYLQLFTQLGRIFAWFGVIGSPTNRPCTTLCYKVHGFVTLLRTSRLYAVL
jgi:hypothetical protein